MSTNELPASPSNEDPLFDTAATAQYLHTSEPTLERWRKLGKGPDWVKMGAIVRYRKSALDRFIDECTRSAHRARRSISQTAA